MTPDRAGSRAGCSRARFAWRLLAPASLPLVGLALRLHRLEAQSFWYDEGTSAALASRSAADILRAAASDIHPPLYYLSLAGWWRLTGDTDFALRCFSALAGTVLVALVVGLASRLWSRPAGLAAGWTAAWSPFLVWYGQEARMYALGATLGLAAVALAVAQAPVPVGARRAARARARAAPPGTERTARARDADAKGGPPAPARRPRRAPLLLASYIVVAAATLHTQYLLGAAALAAANLAMLGATFFRPRGAPPPDRRAWAAWLGAQALAAASLAPWLSAAWPALRDWPAVGPHLSPGRVLEATATAYALGARVPPQARSLVWLTLAPAVLGLLAGLAPRRRRSTAVALACAAASPALLAMLSLSRPAWDAKFVLAGASGFELLTGFGVAALATAVPASAGARAVRVGRIGRGASRPIRVALALGVLLCATWPRLATLRAVYHDPAYQRDDYRGIARSISESADARDAVLLDAPTQIEVYDRYHTSAAALYPLPEGRRPQPDDTRRRLARIADTHRDLYGVLWAVDEADPDGVVEDWLDRNRHKVLDEWRGNVRLALWAAAREPVVTAGRMPVAFGDELQLTRLRYGPRLTRPGDIITLEAVWLTSQVAPAADYRVFLHLVDGVGAMTAQRDMAPIGGSARTSAWAPAAAAGRTPGEGEGGGPTQRHVDRMGLKVPAAAATGEHRLLLGLYDPATGRRLPVRPAAGPPSEGDSSGSADSLVVGTVLIAPAPAAPTR